MDLNQLYFDHQILLIRADGATTPHARLGHEREAADVAARIGERQVKMGAAAACAWMARSWAPAA